MLAYCEARKSDRGDWGPIDILLRRSTDGGKTWDAPRSIANVPGPKAKNPVALAQNLANPDDVTYNNPVAIVNRNGTVHFLFCLEYARCFHISSTDDGLTFTAPEEITATFEKFRPEYDWKVIATGPAHGIMTRSGRFVVPVWMSTGTGGHAHRPSVTATIFSDDGGRTWQRGEIAVPNTDEWIFPNETVIAELGSGRIMLNVRTESKANRRLVTLSPNGATKWTKPAFDDALKEPICMASLLQLTEQRTGGRDRLIFANPDNLSRADGKEEPGKSRDRKNVSVKLSYDEGKTWAVNKTLEPGFSGYSDLAALADGTMLCFYERGSTDGKTIYKTGLLTLARFNLEWLTDGADTWPESLRPAELQPLFVAGTEGYGRYRIPALHVSPKGTLLAFAEGRKKAGQLTGDIDLVLRRSFDGGNTWQPLQRIVDIGTDTCGNPCALTDPATGTIWLAFTKSRGEDHEADIVAGKVPFTQVWMTHSKDDGATWAAPVEISATARRDGWGWYGTGPGTGLVLKGGRLFFPSYHTEGGDYRSHSLVSDDHGATWKLGGTVAEHTSESQAIIRADGSLLINCRNTLPGATQRITATSTDGGDRWTPEPTALPEHNCYGCIHRMPGTDTWLFANTGNPSRANTLIWLSDDAGKTWPAARVIAPGPSAYAVVNTLPDGRIGFLVERGNKATYEQVAFGRVSADWLRSRRAPALTQK